jgi:hypothetical protein
VAARHVSHPGESGEEKMASDSETLKGILRELENIGFLMGDVNEIRNGNYDPPSGANPTPRRSRAKTLDDLFNVLAGIHAETMRQTELLEAIADTLEDEDDDDSADDEPFDPATI